MVSPASAAPSSASACVFKAFSNSGLRETLNMSLNVSLKNRTKICSFQRVSKWFPVYRVRMRIKLNYRKRKVNRTEISFCVDSSSARLFSTLYLWSMPCLAALNLGGFGQEKYWQILGEGGEPHVFLLFISLDPHPGQGSTSVFPTPHRETCPLVSIDRRCWLSSLSYESLAFSLCPGQWGS